MIIKDPFCILILLLSGSGSRFQSTTPKQYLPFSKEDGRPVFSVTADTLLSAGFIDSIIFVPSIDYIHSNYFLEPYHILQNKYSSIYFNKVVGGSTRHLSFINAFKYLQENFITSHKSHTIETWSNSVLLSHDANRPFLTSSFLSSISQAITKISQDSPCFIPVVHTPDSLVLNSINQQTTYLNREYVFRVQTPQVLSASVFEVAYNKKIMGKLKTDWTDEGSFMSDMGYPVQCFDGDSYNKKITYPGDL